MPNPVYLTPESLQNSGLVQTSPLRVPKALFDPTTHRQQLVAVEPSPYVPLQGDIVRDDGYGVLQSSLVRCKLVTVTAGAPAQAQSSPGSTYRWIASNLYTNTTSWWPVGQTQSTYPRMEIVHRWPTVYDPILDSAYSYNYLGRRVSVPAMTFNRAGYLRLQVTSGSVNNWPSMTLIWVLVPHAGPGAYWPLFDTGEPPTSARRLQLRYAKGVFEVWSNDSKLVSYTTRATAGEPIIVALSLDTVAKVGRFMIIDRSRTSRNFNIASLSGIDVNSFIGMRLSTATGADYVNAPDFDLIEMDMWTSSLDLRQMEAAMTTMKAVYQPS